MKYATRKKILRQVAALEKIVTNLHQAAFDAQADLDSSSVEYNQSEAGVWDQHCIWEILDAQKSTVAVIETLRNAAEKWDG